MSVPLQIATRCYLTKNGACIGVRGYLSAVVKTFWKETARFILKTGKVRYGS